jgi:hypothetical protein
VVNVRGTGSRKRPRECYVEPFPCRTTGLLFSAIVPAAALLCARVSREPKCDMKSSQTPLEFLDQELADAETAWSVGSFGAIAEFMRDADEVTAIERGNSGIAAVTARGGLRVQLHPRLRLIATESLTTESWSHRVALCLRREVCTMNGRTELTEIGPDTEALRAEDRDGVLFDLGLGLLQVDACVRTADPSVVAALRRYAGQSVFATESGAMGVLLQANPHRVFSSRVARAEVFQAIPPPDGTSPDGPHTHVLPRLLAHGRTHAATEPLPAGWIPCAHCYPPHPLRDGMGRSRAFQQKYHSAFQSLLTRYGDPESVALKRRIISSVAAGLEPFGLDLPQDRFARATTRITLRQLRAEGSSSAVLAAWLSAHDRPRSEELENLAEAHR